MCLPACKNLLTLKPLNVFIHYMISFLLGLSTLFLIGCEEQEPIAQNHNPEIVKFGLLGTGVQAGNFGTLVCLISDADGDSLTYIWTAPEGFLEGSGDTVYWRAPKEISVYPIYCRVEDPYGAYVEVGFHVQVFPNMVFSESIWTIYNSGNTNLSPFFIDYLSSVKADKFGQVWTGDFAGQLYKYDGTAWQPLNFNIGSVDLISIDIDANDHVWVIAEGGQLIEFDGTDLIAHPHSKKHAKNMVIDQSNNLWIAYWDQSGPSKFDGANWEDFDSLGLPPAMDIAIDQQGDIWYTADSALVHYDHNAWEIIEGPVPQWKQSIVIDQQDRIWVASQTHELALYDPTGWTYFPIPLEGSHGLINDILIYGNTVWCACDGGISIFDGDLAQMSGSAGWQTVITSDNAPLPAGYITSLTLDIHGNIWGASNAYGASGLLGGGLFKIELSNE